MKLSSFINERMEDIITEWESFARTNIPAADDMSTLALRDHAKQILQAIALDIETRQNKDQQYDKSQGLAPDTVSGESAASIHGALRQASNFSLLQLSAEFRALRATVLRLWLPQVKQMDAATAYEMVRFNEAIDQALAESIVTYSSRTEYTRDLFLAILGHDLRTPLSTMALAGELLTHSEMTHGQVVQIGGRVRRSAHLMRSMVDDLLGYTRTQLGGGMPMQLQQTDIKEICHSVIEDASATHPDSKFDLHTVGNLTGSFDAVRLHQLFANLLVNAAQYGMKERAILIDARGEPDAIIVQVTNYGPAIPEALLPSMFQPLIQLSTDNESETRPRTSLGLGLFVAREITVGHGGTIDVKSDAVDGTTFTVRLPRTAVQ